MVRNRRKIERGRDDKEGSTKREAARTRGKDERDEAEGEGKRIGQHAEADGV